ncbi:hypothetical protein QAD02_001716 [Eretmocerus hayati]|uniref:Uncharacterized protein n=1 Tax=Eretmocerus hayati TaxID=131215 RepID=A0ACC2NH78_9HYME|nr:hypothetical protein QAD02_001716 [Eretmocerus hayati]
MSSKLKKDYSKYFEFDHDEEGKIGICRICKNKNVKKEVKMKQSNTSGLQRHLKIFHQKEYEVLFSSKQTSKKASKVTELRYGSITASKTDEAAHCETQEGSLVKQVYGASKKYDSKHLKRGRLLERQVFDELRRKGRHLTKSGFHILPKSPIFGDPLDGIGLDYTLEIECPISGETFKNYGKNGKVSNMYKGRMMLQILVCGKKGLFCVAD